MSAASLIALPCRVSPGGFSDERVFRVQQADGATHGGACSVEYCFTKDGKPFKADEPPGGCTVEAIILASYVREYEDGTSLVSIPDGEVIVVKSTQIREAPPAISQDVLV